MDRRTPRDPICQVVAKDVMMEIKDDLFAAIPPLQALKMLLSLLMTVGIGWQKD